MINLLPFFLSIFVRFTDPRLQDSYGSNGCSPQGFVDSILPIFGVGLALLILSMNMMPGSPIFHAASDICVNTSFALRRRTVFLVLGLIRGEDLSCFTAFMNLSVTATDILKFTSSCGLSFAHINSNISGWSTLKIPIFAPLRVPPCFITSVPVLKTFIKDTGPLAIPPVEETRSSLGRRLLKENPVPPPVWWIIAVFFTA